MATNVAGQVADFAAAITTSDTAANIWSYLYVGGAGNIVLVPEGNSSSVTLTALPVGSWVWVRTKQILATGTTATNLVGFQ
jgi:hypothetical protein